VISDSLQDVKLRKKNFLGGSSCGLRDKPVCLRFRGAYCFHNQDWNSVGSSETPIRTNKTVCRHTLDDGRVQLCFLLV